MSSEESISISPRTPPTQTANVANAYDVQNRVNIAERQLSIARTKLTREIRKNRRFQQQILEYMEALARAVQDCNVMRYHFELVSSSHLALSQEFQNAKVMVETLEAVIRMLHTPSVERLNSSDSRTTEEQLIVDDRD